MVRGVGGEVGGAEPQQSRTRSAACGGVEMWGRSGGPGGRVGSRSHPGVKRIQQRGGRAPVGSGGRGLGELKPFSFKTSD